MICKTITSQLAVILGVATLLFPGETAAPMPEMFPVSNSGVITVPLPEGVLIPTPHEVTYTGKKIPFASCAIVTSKDASLTEKTAGDEIAAQIRYLGGNANVVTEVPPAVSAVVVIGTDHPVFRKNSIAPVGKPEGFFIKAVHDAGRAIVLIAGDDRFGAFWGAQTFKQLIRKDGANIVFTEAAIRDWPDVKHRIAPGLWRDSSRCDFVARMGRINWTMYEPWSWAKREIVFDAEPARQAAAAGRSNGMRCIAFTGLGFWKDQLRRTKGAYCPIEKLGEFEDLVSMLFAAGMEGIEIGFDDLDGYTNLAYHFRDHDTCRERFPAVADWQTFIIRKILAVSERYNVQLFTACPTLYADGMHSQEKKFKSVMSDLNIKNDTYLRAFCDFPGSDKVMFWHCNFSERDRAALAQWGFKNFAWWNNGPWSGAHSEVFGRYVSFARMGYSWFMYDPKAMGTAAVIEEKILTNNLKELAALGDAASCTFYGTGDIIGQTLGGIFSWNTAAYLDREPSVRDSIINNLFGGDVSREVSVWEVKAKRLLLKQKNMELMTARDRADVESIKGVCDALSLRSNPKNSQIISDMKKFCGEMSVAVSVFEKVSVEERGAGITNVSYTGNAGGLVLHLGVETANGKTDALSVEGKPLIAVEYDGKKGFYYSRSKLHRADPSFAFSEKSFSVEVLIVPFNMNWCKLAGTRTTIREIYPGGSGWGFGYQQDGKLQFTVEDTAKTKDTVVSGKRLETFKPFHVVAVREYESKKLYLYINGEKAGETDEKGSGDFGQRNGLEIGYDVWTGGYFLGVLNQLNIYGRAMVDNEIRDAYASRK